MECLTTASAMEQAKQRVNKGGSEDGYDINIALLKLQPKHAHKVFLFFFVSDQSRNLSAISLITI